MTFKGKEVKVIMGGDAKEEFGTLNKSVGDEITKGITSSDNQTLLNSVKQKIEFLRDNPQYGIHIPKNLIPKEYTQKYDVGKFMESKPSKSMENALYHKGKRSRDNCFNFRDYESQGL